VDYHRKEGVFLFLDILLFSVKKMICHVEFLNSWIFLLLFFLAIDVYRLHLFPKSFGEGYEAPQY